MTLLSHVYLLTNIPHKSHAVESFAGRRSACAERRTEAKVPERRKVMYANIRVFSYVQDVRPSR